MSDTHIPRKRSAAEWSYLIRRERVLRAVRHPALTPAAKQVLVLVSCVDDDPFILPERVPVRALARQLALAERTVRQAICELVEQGCLTLRANGQFFRPGEGPPADPDLAREWAFLSEARADPSRADYLDTLARLRDHAVAAKRIATAVSAERALGRALLDLGAEQMRRGEAAEEQMRREADEVPLGAPENSTLDLVARIIADRALAPSARHVLIEVMLDRLQDPVDFPEDDRDRPWSHRIARRHGITVRGARKALAELEDLRLVAQANGDVCVYPDRVEERLRRGTYVPPQLPLCEGLDPLQAHRHRLERLRDLALAEGLVATAVSAHRAIGRVLGYDGAKRGKKKEMPKPAAAPPAEPQPKPLDIMPFIRGMIDADPDAGRMMREVIAEIRAEEAGASVRAM